MVYVMLEGIGMFVLLKIKYLERFNLTVCYGWPRAGKANLSKLAEIFSLSLTFLVRSSTVI